jgi:hypothetical protein
MSFGKINWANLLDYTVQPSDLDLFQNYMAGVPNTIARAQRTNGVIAGGIISPTSGLGISISAGLAIMPDGTLISFPALVTTLAAADPSNPRIDRIELKYSVVNNTQVIDVNSQTKTLDLLIVGALNVVSGVPASTPVAGNATSANVSLGFVQVNATQSTLLLGNISQIVDSSFVVSAFQFGPTGYVRFNSSSGLMQFSNDGIRWQAFGSGGGGGGGSTWQPVQGAAPIETFEIDEKAWQFAQGQGQELALMLKVPSSYLSGSQIKMKLAHYSPGTTGFFKFQTTATLIRRNQDSVLSTTNQRVSTNADTALNIANEYLEASYDLTSTSGQINGTQVSGGDMIKVLLQRVTPSGSEDINEVRMIPSSMEVSFA